MRHAQFVTIVLALLLVGVGTLAVQPTGAQDATPAAMSGHPLVGAWMLDADVDDPANPPEVIIFTGDGLALGVDGAGDITIGAWEPTGERTVAITLNFFLPGEDGAYGGMGTVRVAGEVAEDGQSFTAPYTLEIVTPDGTATGEFGPTTAMATRMAVEAMGTPVAPLSALFAQMAGTPTP